MIPATEVLNWLRTELHQDGHAVYLEQLLADSALNADLRLLHFSYALWPEMPSVWRGRSLDAENIDAAARAAIDGSVPDTQWLASLADGRAFDFFDTHGHSQVAASGRQWLKRRTEYEQTWDTLIGRGAPDQARPPANVALAITARLACSEPYRTDLRERALTLLGPTDWLRRAPWFLHFGSAVDQLSDVQIEVLRHLEQASLLNDLVVAHLDDLGELTPERLQILQSGLVISETQRRAIRKLSLLPGSKMVTLLPGQRHEPPEARTLGRTIARGIGRWICAIVQQIVHWLASTARRRNAPAAPSLPVPELRLEVRMVRVKLETDVPVESELAWLARVSWDAPENSSSRVVIKQLTFPFELPRLKTQLLPARGQFMTLLFDSSSLRLVRRQGRWRHIATAPIEIWFGPQQSMNTGTLGTMKGIDKTGPVGSLTQSVGNMTPVLKHIVVQHQPIVGNSLSMTPIDSSGMLRCISMLRGINDSCWKMARLPTPRELKIFRLLMSPMVGGQRRDP